MLRARRTVRLLLVLVIALTASSVVADPAAAHPLGNFTTNRHARVVVGASVVRVHYVLDEAELVAFRQRGALAATDADAFALARAEEIRDGLRLSLDGRVVPLTTVSSRLTQPAGQGGLTTLRIDTVFETSIAGRDEIAVSFEDRNQPGLLGWREILVSTSGGASLRGSAPTIDRTDGLRRYPTDPGIAPLDVRSVRFSFRPGDGADAAVLERADADGRTVDAAGGGRFLRLVEETSSSPLTIGLALLVAFGFGAVHAVGPGHGKTVMAAYLVSTRGRRRDALALGAVVSLMHTAAVLALAGVLATVGRDVDAARIYPWLTLVAGVLVIGVGARLLRSRLRSTARGRAHEDEHHDHHHLDDHDHGHGHGPVIAAPRHGGAVAVLERPRTHEHAPHDHGHEHGPDTHTHDLPDGVRPLSRAGLVALGTSGGLFPSPSAVVVLLGAFAAGRAGLGLALIAAFSAGLAAVLVALGLVLVAGRERLLRAQRSVSLRWLPSAGAAAIVVLGIVLVAQGMTQLR